MVNAYANEGHRSVLQKIMESMPEAREGDFFGYPAWYVHERLFACVYHDAIAVRVPEKVATGLLLVSGIEPFRPTGKMRIREWVQINRQMSEEYIHDLDIFETAFHFVLSLSKVDRKGASVDE